MRIATGVSGGNPSGTTEHDISYYYDTYGRLEGAKDDDGQFYHYDFVLGTDRVDAVYYATNGSNTGTGADLSSHWDYTGAQFFVDKVTNRNGALGTAFATYDYDNDVVQRREWLAVSGTAAAIPHVHKVHRYYYDPSGDLDKTVPYSGTSIASPGSPQTGSQIDYNYNLRRARDASSNGFTYTPNNFNQYNQINSTNVGYDRGNVTSLPVSGGTKTMNWNRSSQLTKATFGSEEVISTFDGEGRRLIREVKSGGSTTKKEAIIYDGWNPIAVYNINGSVSLKTTYVWGRDLAGEGQGAGGVGGLLTAKEHSGGYAGRYFFTYDANGNVSQILEDNNTTTPPIKGGYAYDPFGNLTNTVSGYMAENPFRFSTKYWDKETGLYYYGYRFYEPQHGMWLSRDPLGEAGGFNLYAFVQNDPINNVDYLGMAPLNGQIEFMGDPGIGGGVAEIVARPSRSQGRLYHRLRFPVIQRGSFIDDETLQRRSDFFQVGHFELPFDVSSNLTTAQIERYRAQAPELFALQQELARHQGIEADIRAAAPYYPGGRTGLAINDYGFTEGALVNNPIVVFGGEVTVAAAVGKAFQLGGRTLRAFGAQIDSLLDDAFRARGVFTPGPKTGLSLPVKLGPSVKGKASVRIESNQVFGMGNEILTASRPGPRGNQQGFHHLLRGEFRETKAELWVDWMGTTQGNRGIGLELLSNAIEATGARRFSGQLGALNRKIYEDLVNKGTPEIEAVWSTPVGRQVRRLGFEVLEFDEETLRFVFSL